MLITRRYPSSKDILLSILYNHFRSLSLLAFAQSFWHLYKRNQVEKHYRQLKGASSSISKPNTDLIQCKLWINMRMITQHDSFSLPRLWKSSMQATKEPKDQTLRFDVAGDAWGDVANIVVSWSVGFMDWVDRSQ